MNQFFLALILSFTPVLELRAGLPLALDYALRNNIPIFLIFLPVVLVNISSIFFFLFFLDFLHSSFMRISFYRKIFNYYLINTREKIKNFEKKFAVYGFLALALFTAVPLPATGAWTATFIAWFLGLERKKSILSISAGVLIAGIIVLIASLGIFKLLSI